MSEMWGDAVDASTIPTGRPAGGARTAADSRADRRPSPRERVRTTDESGERRTWRSPTSRWRSRRPDGVVRACRA
jgi:hypothetical protein